MKGEETSLRDGIVALASIAVLLALLKMAGDIVVPFLLSLFIALIASGPLNWLKRRGLSTALSVTVVVIGIVLVVVVLALVIGSTATQFNEALPAYQARINEILDAISGWLKSKNISAGEAGILSAIDPSSVLGFANSMVRSIGNTLSDFMLIMFIVIFMLIEATGFQEKLSHIKSIQADTASKKLEEITSSINGYVVAKSVISLITGVIIWILLELVGLDFAPLWGFVAFILNFVPTIGSILAAVPAVLLALLQFDLPMVLVVVAIYITTNTLIGNVLEPMLIGQRVGLSTLAVFLSLIFWGWMFGPVGMLLSVPLSMGIKFAAMSHSNTRWLAVLLSPLPDKSKNSEQAAGEQSNE